MLTQWIWSICTKTGLGIPQSLTGSLCEAAVNWKGITLTCMLACLAQTMELCWQTPLSRCSTLSGTRSAVLRMAGLPTISSMTCGCLKDSNAQLTECQVHQQLLQESFSMSVTPVQSVAPATNVMPLSQQLKSDEARQARMARMLRMSDKDAPTQQPISAPVVSKQGGRDVPSKCSACMLPRKDTHNSGGCPTHCLECKEKKDQCSCPLYCLGCRKERWKQRCICPKHCLTCKRNKKQCNCS